MESEDLGLTDNARKPMIRDNTSSGVAKPATPIIFPKVLNFQALDLCNSRCIMCNIWRDGRRDKLSIEELREELKHPFYSEVIHVGVTGGEPTLRKDLAELYELFPEVLPKLTGASFITHGMQTERAVETYSRVNAFYKARGLTFDGMVSLDGVGEIHDRVRGRKGAFDAATKTLRGLKEKGVTAIAACTIVRANVYHLHDLLDWAKSNEVYVRFRVAEFIRRLYNDSCSGEIRGFDARELRHLVSFIHVLLGEYESNETIRKTYQSILSLLTGGDRLIGCSYQRGGSVNVDSRGWLACCAPKGESFDPVSDASAVSEMLEAQRRDVLQNHCANCIHDYHDDWNERTAHEIAQARVRSQELYEVSEERLTTPEMPGEAFGLSAMKEVLLAGWYGTETAGDIAILQGIIEEYLAVNPSLRFRVLSLFPYYTRTTVALWPEELRAKVAVIDYASEAAWQATVDCDAVVMAGGPLMDIGETRKILCLFKRFAELGKPRVIEGCGVGPLNRADFRWNVCRIARLATKISVRDSASRDALRFYGIRKPVEVRLDPAVTFVRGQGIRHHGSDRKVIRCFLRELTCEYPQAVSSDQATRNLEALLTRLLEWYPEHRIELWAMHHFPVGNDDRLFARQLVKRIANPRLVCEWEPRTPREILEAMAGAEFCVCMRFHSCVFATEVGVPFLAVDYTAGGKINAFLNDIRQQNRLTGLAELPGLDRARFEAKVRTPVFDPTAMVPTRVAERNNPPRVLHVIQNVIGGGGARAMISLARHSRRLAGYEHRLVSLGAADAVGLDLARAAKLEVLNQPDKEALERAMAESDIVLVHWWNNPDLAGLFLRDLPPMRLALWLHVGGYHAPQVFSRALIDYADLTVGCSPHTYAHPVFSGLPEPFRGDRTAMVLAGAEFDRLQGLKLQPHDGFRVGYIGTVDPIKMHSDFVAMSCAIDVPGARFVVCGNGDTRWLTVEAEKRGRSGSFEFRGPVEDIRSVLETLDVYGYPLCPDTYAAAELNLQEAMFAGLPVVAFPYGGIGKLIRNGETGILVESADDYARAIERLHRDPAERARLGANAAAFARKHWGAESAAREFNVYFERLLARPKRSRQWGVVEGAGGNELPLSIADRIPPLAIYPGARLFVESLGEAAGPFLDSLTTNRLEAVVDAEERIAALPRLVHNTGVQSYRNAFPKDPFLALWAGLGLLKRGDLREAFGAFSASFQNGFSHWRVHWYRALTAERAGERGEAAAALKLLLEKAPDFGPAREMQIRLGVVLRPELAPQPATSPMETAQRYVEQAERLLQEGQTQRARDWLERALDLVPRQLDLMEALSELDCRLGDLEPARRRYQAILAIDPERNSPRLDSIRRSLGIETKPMQKKPQISRTELDAIVRAAANAIRRRDDRAAVEALEQARRVAPKHVGVLAALGNLHLRQDNALAAIEALKDAASVAGNDPFVHVLLARAALKLERIQEFESALARALEIDPDFPPAHRLLGDLMLTDQQPVEAAAHYRKVLEKAGPDVGLLLSLAKCLDLGGEAEAASSAREEAGRLAGEEAENAEALARLTGVAAEPDAPSKGVAAVKDAPSQETPAVGGARDGVGEYLGQLEKALAVQDMVTAEKVLRQAHGEYPANAELATALANLQFQCGHFEDAVPTFKAVCALKPNDPVLPVLLAHCCMNSEDAEGVEAAIQLAFKVQPGNPHAVRFMADMNVKLGRHREAAHGYGQLIQGGSTDAEVLLALGVCFQKIGDKNGAIACFTEVIRQQPAHTEANRRLAELSPKPAVSSQSALQTQSQMDHEKVGCPKCGSRDARVVRNRADIVQCGACQIVYLRTRLTKDAMRKLYQSYADGGSHMALPKSIEEADKSGLARDYFLKEILEFVEPKGGFLDVGCGWGGFLHNARKKGFEPRGIELTRKCVGYANETLGIPVVDTQLEETGIPAGSLSVVSMNHVLEHLPEPKKALKKVIDSLRPGGMYCGMVPNFDSACSSAQTENWYWLDPFYHYTHFTPATLRRTLEEAGFVVERIYTATGDYGAENVRKACLPVDPKLADNDYFAAEIKRYETEGRGEEIRFFARKPTTTVPADQDSANASEYLLIDSPGMPQDSVVSVVVSTYQSEKLIRACLTNLTRQTIFDRCEVIVVDSGSPENERAIVEEFQAKHPNIRYLRTHRETLYAAWNRGLELARGKFWVNANTDDALRDDALEILVAAMEKHQDCALAYGDTAWTSVPNDTFPSKNILQTVKYGPYAPADTLFYCVTGCLQFWRSETLRQLGGFDATLKFAGDYEATLKLMRAGLNAVHVPEVLSLFFQNTGGLTQSSKGADEEHEQVMNSARQSLDIGRVFRVLQGDANSLANAWSALGLKAAEYRVPWEKAAFVHGDFAAECFRKGLEAAPNNDIAGRNYVRMLETGGSLATVEERLRARFSKAADWIFRVRGGEGLNWSVASHAVSGRTYRPAEWVHRPTAEQLGSEPAALRPWITRIDGRHVYLSEDLFPAPAGSRYTPEEHEGIAMRLAGLLRELPDFYAHFGGAGDALLLLASFYDQKPDATVFSYPNSVGATKALFDGFPKLGRIYFLPAHADAYFHIVLRYAIRVLKNCLGAGATPREGYEEEWKAGLDITRRYGINKSPKWAAAMRKNSGSKRVALAPMGSMAGMVGSKRNIIDPAVWPDVVAHVIDLGFEPVIFGLPPEAKDYPALVGCVDARGKSFAEQMSLIGECAGLVGADSWGKTFSGLAGIPALVFEPLKGPDLLGWKDPADWVFIEPWPSIRMVSSLEAFRAAFDAHIAGRHDAATANKPKRPVVAWEGSFLDYGSLSHINRELSRHLADDGSVRLTCVSSQPMAAGAAEDPAMKKLARNVSVHAPEGVALTIRHQWPPNWSPVSEGKLVVIQPWEYGALPQEWVAQAGNVDEFWVPSRIVRSMYMTSGIPPQKVRVLPNGVDIRKFRPGAQPLALPTRKKFKFLFVGGTIHRKGPDILLNAYLNAFKATDDVCLVIKDFGGGSVYRGQTAADMIAAARKQPNAPEILHLTEELPADKMPSLYAACDCLVHPYRGEGFGMPVLEAMACGLPVVVTQGGSTADFVSLDAGWFIPAREQRLGRKVGDIPLVGECVLLEPSMPHLASILREIAGKPQEVRAKGAAGRGIVERRFDWSDIAALASFYVKDLLSRATEANVLRTAAPSPGKVPDMAAAKTAPKPFVLPKAALVGHIGEARELLQSKKHRAAWDSASAAIAARPFHPEGWLLLGQIALEAGDSKLAGRCTERVKALAPQWKPGKELAKAIQKRSNKRTLDWPLPAVSEKPRLTVCLIAKNEERFLGQCLASVKDLADEVVVVDTGSTDKTVEIAKSFGAKTGHFEWCDDFSAARNAALELATGDWILVLDADEELMSQHVAAIHEEMSEAGTMAWRLPLINAGKEADGVSFVPRLFRNAPALFYVGRVHEQVFTSIVVRCGEWGLENKLGRTRLLHHGYTEEMTRDRNKIERNLKLLERAIEEIPGDANLTFNHGLELVRSGKIDAGLARYSEAAEILGGQSTEEIVPELREVILTQWMAILKDADRLDELLAVRRQPLFSKGTATASMHYMLGFAALRTGDAELAVHELRACLAVRDTPGLTPIHRDLQTCAPEHCLALALVRSKEAAAARDAFGAALERSPAARPVVLDLARFEAGEGDYGRALTLLYELVQTAPDDVGVWRLGAAIALNRPEVLEVALDWTQSALASHPDDAELRGRRAEALLLAGRSDEARPFFELLVADASGVHLAGALICRLVAGEMIGPAVAGGPDLTQAFLQWYRRLVDWNASAVVQGLNARMADIEKNLPAAARILQAVLADAGV